MAKISSWPACIAVVAALLLSGIGVALPIDSARADDNCVTAPGGAPPEGQHWYYRTDRVKHHKCWYLHATAQLPNHAAAEPPAAVPVPASPVATSQSPSATTPQTTNAASLPQPDADGDSSNPPSEATSTQPAPHVTVLPVKTVTAPLFTTTSASQAATPAQTDEPPTPQISPSNASVADVPVDGDTVARGADPSTVPAAPDTAHNALAPAAAAATTPAPTHSAHLFFPPALALGIAAALIAFISKMAGLTRTPRLSDRPDDASLRYRTAHQQADETAIHEEDAPFLAPQEPYGSADADAREWIEQSPPAQSDYPVERPHGSEAAQSEQVGLTLNDIELALRILRQERRHVGSQ